MNAVVFAPHQDDEILGACLYMEKLVKQGDTVFVVFATNGDYLGRDLAAQRAYESINALTLSGIAAEHVYFMGFGDTGMHPAESFLLKLFNSRKEQAFSTPNSTVTYSPLEGQTVYSLLWNTQAPYTRNSFKNGLNGILLYLQPQLIIAPSRYDYHGDHKALALFIDELLLEHTTPIPVYSYLLHSGDDLLWPDRQLPVFSRPGCVPQHLWDTRVVLKASADAANHKLELIRSFVTQNPEEIDSFLCSFAKHEEFFLREFISQPL